MAYTKDGISALMEKAVAEVVMMIDKPLVKVSGNARILANYTEKGGIVLPVYNPSDKDTIIPVVEIDSSLLAGKTVRSEEPFTDLGNGRYRLRLEPDATACLILE